MRLHDAHHAEDRFAGHQAVGVERKHQLVVAAPTLAEVAQVARLVARILRTAAIDDLVRIGERSFPSLHRLLLGGRDGGIARVAQNEVAELATIAGPIEALFDCLEA